MLQKEGGGMLTKRYSVLVVDDSAFMRKLISDMISDDDRFSEVYTAKNGQEAVEKTKQLRPSVISLDIEMPVLNGIEALKQIMKQCPTPVIMLSSMTDRGAKETILALENGAIDFVKKPSGTISLDLAKVKQELLDKLEVAAQTKLTSAIVPVSRANATPPMGQRVLPNKNDKNRFNDIVAIGTSTGGPKALQQVLTKFPENFPAPILIVQHMPPPFTKSLATRLDSLCNIRVVEAQHSMLVQAGTAYIAPGDWHMTLQHHEGEYRISLDQDSPCSGHRPSVDVMFRSLVNLKGVRRHVVLMTGMGRDGATAMQMLRKDQAFTIAEAEQTCVVYGMPKVAVELGAAREIVPLHEIASTIMKNMNL